MKKSVTKSWKQTVKEMVSKYGPMTVLHHYEPEMANPTQEDMRQICKGESERYYGHRTVLLCNDDGFTIRFHEQRITRRGRRYYLRTAVKLDSVKSYGNSLRIQEDKLSDETLGDLFRIFGVRCWRVKDGVAIRDGHAVSQEVRELFGILRKRSGLLKDVLSGRIHSDETLYRRWAVLSYRLKTINWRLFRDYMACMWDDAWIPVGDLTAFTTNVEASMREWLNREDDRGLMKDIVKDAIMDDSTVNLSHSAKRLNEEHLANVRIRMQKEIASKSQDKIHKDLFQMPEGITLLNTELDIFNEGLEMNHCVYTNYCRDIQKHKYLAFRMDYPQRCTFGVTKDVNGKPYLDQIYLSYNRPVKIETRQDALAFVENRNAELTRLLSGQRNNDLPF